MTAVPVFTSGPTPDQARALGIARGLARAGIPIFVAPADPGAPDGIHRLPMRWQWTQPDPSVVDTWRPGDALCALMGVGLDLADIDPRNGGDASWSVMASAGVQPTVYAEAATPSGGRHLFIARLRTGSRDRIRPGVDVKGGRDGLVAQAGRGLAFIAPTVRPSKVTGEFLPYRWVVEPTFLDDDLLPDAGMMADLADDGSGADLAEIVRSELGHNVVYLRGRTAGPAEPDLFRSFTTAQAVSYVNGQLAKLAAARQGGRNRMLFESAILLGHFVPAFLDEAEATALLQRAVAVTGLDDTLRQIALTIRGGLERGMSEPYSRAPDAPMAPPIVQPYTPPPPVVSSTRTVDDLLDPTQPVTPEEGVTGADETTEPSSIAAAVVVPEPGADPVDLLVDHEALRELVRRKARRRADEMEAAELDAQTSDELAAQFLDGTDLDQLPTPDPLIPDVLSRHTYAVLRGRDKSFKSFVAVDWAMCLATGTPWMGKPVEKVKVLYLAAEGAYGLRKRVRAWEQQRGVRLEPGMLTVRITTVNLLRGGPAVAHLMRWIKEGGYGFVVLDTLRRVSGGADGNASQDMGEVIDRIIEIKQMTALGCVLAVAHTDKGDNDTRGASNIEDDGDIVWHCKRAEDDALDFTLKCAKFKDGPDGHAYELRTRVVELDDMARSDGTPETSLVVVKPANVTKVTAPDGVQQQRVLDIIRKSAATGVTARYLIEVERVPRSTAHSCLNALANLRLVRKSGQVWYPIETAAPAPGTVDKYTGEVSDVSA